MRLCFSPAMKLSPAMTSVAMTSVAMTSPAMTRKLAHVACLALCAMVLTPPHQARAQAIVLSVNGDPITSVDLEQRMKLLRALRRPAAHDAAVESMISDRLKTKEAGRFGIIIPDDEIGEEIQRDAKKLKMSPSALSQAIQRAGVSTEHARNHFKADLAYLILVKALNRGVEASEVAVRDELAKERGKSTVTSYTIRQVVFTLSPGDAANVVEANVKEAQALRGRFASCETGIPYAKSLPGVAVREKLTRSSTQLDEGIKDLLDKTPIGHLTEPSRSANGIEMIAVCNRAASGNDDELRKEISDRLLDQHIEEQMAQKYRDMRATAVIEHPRG